MGEQVIILILMVTGLAATLFLYFRKAKKQVEYRGDERWEAVQNKSNRIANLSVYILVLTAVGVDIAVRFGGLAVSVSWNRIFTCVLLFFSLRNLLELCALFYYDRRM